jgi:hypothetical protein
MNTPAATPVTSSYSTPATGGHSKRHIIFSPAFGIANTPTPLCGLENLPTHIPNPEARGLMTNPLQMRASYNNQLQRQWQLQQPVVYTHRFIVSGSRSIHRFGHSDVTRLALSMGRLLEVYLWNRQPVMSARDLETVRYEM